MSSEWRTCGCGKRDFLGRRNAVRALGKAQAKRNRRGDAAGTRRGLKVEHRVHSCELNGWHLTSESRSSYENRVKGAAA